MIKKNKILVLQLCSLGRIVINDLSPGPAFAFHDFIIAPVTNWAGMSGSPQEVVIAAVTGPLGTLGRQQQTASVRFSLWVASQSQQRGTSDRAISRFGARNVSEMDVQVPV